jgi:hypothetical protein
MSLSGKESRSKICKHFHSCDVRIGDKEHSTFMSTELLHLGKVSAVYIGPKVS